MSQIFRAFVEALVGPTIPFLPLLLRLPTLKLLLLFHLHHLIFSVTLKFKKPFDYVENM
jgi:hypothetical protein